MKKLVFAAVAAIALTASVSFVACKQTANNNDSTAVDTTVVEDTLASDTLANDTLATDSVAE